MQGTGTAAWEKVCNLLPGEILLFFEVDEELVVLGGKLELRAAGPLCGCRHSLLAYDARRAMVMRGRGRCALHGVVSFIAMAAGQMVMVGGR